MSKIITEQEALAWKKMYEEDGMSMEAISLEVHSGIKTVRKWLYKVNAEIRKPGGQMTNRRNKAIDGIKGKSEDRIPKAVKRASYTGHRRRAKF